MLLTKIIINAFCYSESLSRSLFKWDQSFKVAFQNREWEKLFENCGNRFIGKTILNREDGKYCRIKGTFELEPLCRFGHAED